MRFRSVVEQAGRTATGIEVPEDVVAALGTSKGPAVSVTVNVEADDALSYSNRWRHVLAVEGARTDATRARRIAGVVAALQE